MGAVIAAALVPAPGLAQSGGLTASFTYSPSAPVTGEQVTFTSTSTSTSGGNLVHEWDLDGDGEFGEPGEPSGPAATTASRSFASVGTYTVGLRVTDVAGASATTTRAVRVAAAPPPPPAPAPTSPPPGGAAPPALVGGGIDGPATVRFGEPATYTARVSGDVSRYDWDIDGSGRFALSTGAQPTLRASLPTLGAVTVRMRATGPGGEAQAARTVSVERPTLTALELSPAVAEPGEAVKMRLVSRSDKSFEPLYYGWKIAGLAPLTRKLSLPRRHGARASAARTRRLSITLSEAQPTAKPQLTRSFPKPGTYPIEVTVVGADGTQSTVATDVRVVAHRGIGLLVGNAPTSQISPCGGMQYAGCAAMLVDTNPGGTNTPITFYDATGDLRLCADLPVADPHHDVNAVAGGPTALSTLSLLKDLPYPDPSQFFDAGVYAPGGIGAPTTKPGGGARAAAEHFKTCKTIRSQTVSWNFGDGTKLEPATAGTDYAPIDPGTVAPTVQHAYTAKGTYFVTLVTRRFYLDKAKLGRAGSASFNRKVYTFLAGDEDDVQDLAANGAIKSHLVSKTVKVTVYDQVCGVVKLNGIPARAWTQKGITGPLDLNSAGPGCFYVIRPAGASHDVYKPVPGQELSLNGIWVHPPTGGTLIVDPQTATVSALEGGNLALTLFYRDAAALAGWGNVNLGSTPQIVVPKPKHNPELNRTVAMLPDYGGGSGKLYGFPISGVRAFLSPETTALARLSVTPREPLNGATPQVVVGGTQGQARSPVPAADFTLDLRESNIGPFRTKEFTLRHIPNEGWQGGGRFSLDLGATSYDLNASYIPDTKPTAERCQDLGVDAGPSGLAMPDDGPFTFAGGSVRNAKIVVGPAEIYCFGASFKNKPFTLIGLIGAHIPPQTNFIGVDVCVLVAILNGGQGTSGCGTFYTNHASATETWIAGRGRVTLLDALTLGTAGFDIHAGAATLKTSAFGRVYFEAGPFYLEGAVTGLVRVKPPPAGFEFTGEVELGIGGCPVCVDVKGIVSSKGIGACVDVLVLSGGFVYKWNGDLSLFGGCSWSRFESIRVASLASLDLGMRSRVGGPLLGVGAAQATVPVRGDEGVAFQVAGAGGAPRVTLVTPSGKRIDGPRPGDRPYVRRSPDGIGFLTVGPPAPARQGVLSIPAAPQTIVTVPKPEEGTYRIEAQPGSVAITGVGTARKLPETKIVADVVGNSTDRRLRYSIRPVPGQTVQFVEEGRTVGRAIGGSLRSRNDGAHTLDFPNEYGSAGKRTVSAIVSQDGVPVRKIRVASYRAPAPPTVPAPSDVRVRRVGGGDTLSACWDAVADAKLYEVTATATDGRVLRERGSDNCATFPNFDASVAAKVSVRAVTAYGTSRSPGQAELRRLALAPPRLAL